MVKEIIKFLDKGRVEGNSVVEDIVRCINIWVLFFCVYGVLYFFFFLNIGIML